MTSNTAAGLKVIISFASIQLQPVRTEVSALARKDRQHRELLPPAGQRG